MRRVRGLFLERLEEQLRWHQLDAEVCHALAGTPFRLHEDRFERGLLAHQILQEAARPLESVVALASLGKHLPALRFDVAARSVLPRLLLLRSGCGLFVPLEQQRRDGAEPAHLDEREAESQEFSVVRSSIVLRADDRNADGGARRQRQDESDESEWGTLLRGWGRRSHGSLPSGRHYG